MENFLFDLNTMKLFGCGAMHKLQTKEKPGSVIKNSIIDFRRLQSCLQLQCEFCSLMPFLVAYL